MRIEDSFEQIMAEAPRYVLYEHAVGYALLRVKEFEDIGLMIPQVGLHEFVLYFLLLVEVLACYRTVLSKSPV